MNRQTGILLVDDEPDVLEVYSSILRNEGYQVWEEQTGEGALRSALAYKPNLIVLDVTLPDISGIEVCRRIKGASQLQDVSVILMSGIGTAPEDKVEGLETQADEYLVKPVALPEFLARIRAIERLQRTAAALRASEEHYRRLLDILPDAVGSVNLQGKLTNVNRQAVLTMGYTDANELMAKSAFELTPSDEHERLMLDMGALLQDGIVQNREYTVLRKNGEAFPVEVSAGLLRGSHGEAPQMVGVARDITQRKRAEARIRQLLDILDQAQDSIIILDHEGRVEYFNKGAERLLGWSAEEVHGKTLTETLSHGNSKLDAAQHALGETGKWSGELHLLTRGNESRIVESRWTRVQAGDARSSYTVIINTDITEHKKAEVLLRQKEELSQRIITSAMDGFWAVDAEGHLLDVNEAYCRLSGYSQEELLSMHISSLDVNEPAPESVSEHIKRIIGRGGDRFETRHRHKSGRILNVEVSATALPLERPRVFAFLRDITGRKQVEDELRRLSQHIIDTQENERFRVAQELHDGVNQIIASAKMRLRKVAELGSGLSPAGREILARCEQLLVEAVEENRRIAHNLRPSDLDDLGLFHTCRNFCAQFRARTNLQVHCSMSRAKPRLPAAVELNAFRIVQEAFNNVAEHARAKSVSLRLTFEENTLVLRIKDDGRGFTRHSGKPGKRKRRGFGLANMQERARSIGGTCVVQSSLGKGTTITVSLPCKG